MSIVLSKSLGHGNILIKCLSELVTGLTEDWKIP